MIDLSYWYLIWIMLYLFDFSKFSFDSIWVFLVVVVFVVLIIIKSQMENTLVGKHKSKNDVIIVKMIDSKQLDMKKIKNIEKQMREQAKEDRLCNRIKNILSNENEIERKIKLLRELVACFDGYEFDEDNKDHMKLKTNLGLMNKLVMVYDGYLKDCDKVEEVKVDDVRVDDVKVDDIKVEDKN